MKINVLHPQFNSSANKIGQKKPATPSADTATAHRSNTKFDRVELSQTAIEMQRAKKMADAVPDIREEKVAEIKTQIENGTYKIDSEKIASKMIRESILLKL